MKTVLFSLFALFAVVPGYAATSPSCGDGYILVDAPKVDGIKTFECQKLWCRDLETGRAMGSGERAASGYAMTSSPVEICDSKRNCVTCWGERKWCAGETRGEWMPEFGAYTRGGTDNPTYKSMQKGSCFVWRLEKPDCPEGETAVLKDGEWVCATAAETTDATRKSSIRRTGTMRRIR